MRIKQINWNHQFLFLSLSLTETHKHKREVRKYTQFTKTAKLHRVSRTKRKLEKFRFPSRLCQDSKRCAQYYCSVPNEWLKKFVFLIYSTFTIFFLTAYKRVVCATVWIGYVGNIIFHITQQHTFSYPRIWLAKIKGKWSTCYAHCTSGFLLYYRQTNCVYFA